MANTPKYARKTAKAHANASRKSDTFGALGNKTTATSKGWPKRWPTESDQKAAEYVPRYTSRNSEFQMGKN
jgi:hypothetical protein